MFSSDIRPRDYGGVLGNEKVIDILKSDKQKINTLFWGEAGCGKTTLALIYGGEDCKYIDASVISLSEIKSLRGVVILDEIEALDARAQRALLYNIENGLVTVIGTTNEHPGYFQKGLRSRLRCLNIEYPGDELILERISIILYNYGYEDIDKENLLRIIHQYHDVRKCMDELGNIISGNKINYDIKYNGYNVEELKSALQKSIRGSDVDASCLYASKLMEMQEMDLLIRRLRVIVSEDIGLANPNAVLVVNALLDNANKVGYKEGMFPIMEAVAFMALQPKSNSMHTIIDNLKNIGYISVPDHIKYVHPIGYKYPHDYDNNWVKQNYMPNGLENITIYKPGINKVEKSYYDYWKKVKYND